jgi:hypothetical protein
MLQCSNYQPQTPGCVNFNSNSGAIRGKGLKERKRRPKAPFCFYGKSKGRWRTASLRKQLFNQ